MPLTTITAFRLLATWMIGDLMQFAGGQEIHSVPFGAEYDTCRIYVKAVLDFALPS